MRNHYRHNIGINIALEIGMNANKNYVVIDSATGIQVSSHASSTLALNAAERRNKKYGSFRYTAMQVERVWYSNGEQVAVFN